MRRSKEELGKLHKEQCRELKTIRAQMAADLGIDLKQRECTYEGYCSGTCRADYDSGNDVKRLCPEEWNINIETSLNVPRELLEPIANERFCFIIDVKAMQPERYLAYTGEENTRVKENLCYLMERLPQENYVVNVPQIPNFCV